MIPIPVTDLIIMNDLCRSEPLAVDLVYAQAAHPDNIFKTALYRADAPFILHRRLADIIVLAARDLHARYGWTLVLKDGLRTIEAQQAVFDTPVVRAHPEWVSGPDKMFASPGGGGHPRAMAVDVGVRDNVGDDLDFGTPFDAMPGNDRVNRAHRNFIGFGGPEYALMVVARRQKLTQAMLDAASDCGETLWPLPHEWWDYRLVPPVFNAFAPLSEGDLPPSHRMMS